MLALITILACDVGDTSRAVTSTVVGRTVEASKGVVDGLQEGIEDGRKSAESVDGSLVVSTAAEVAAATALSVWAVEDTDAGVDVVLSIENLTHQSLHLIGLDGEGGALLIDPDGFATALGPNAPGTTATAAIVVPPKAKVKATLPFPEAHDGAAAVRVWGAELPVPG